MKQEIKLGKKLDDARPADYPESKVFQGKYVRLQPFNADKMFKSLYDNYKETPQVWDYVFESPPKSLQEYYQSCKQKMKLTDRVIYGVYKVGDLDDCVGQLALARIETNNRVIEFGAVIFSSKLQSTTASTEAFYLLMKYCFQDLRYLRLGWKCNTFNQPSKKAALRLGFVYEGTIKRNVVYKNNSLDGAWFALIDDQWPIAKSQIERWLSPDNFDEKGVQKTKLSIHYQDKILR